MHDNACIHMVQRRLVTYNNWLRKHIDYSIRPHNPGQPADSAICHMATSSYTQLTPRRLTSSRASGKHQERSSFRNSIHVHQRRLVFSEEGSTDTKTYSCMSVNRGTSQTWSKDEIIKDSTWVCAISVEEELGLVTKGSLLESCSFLHKDSV